MMKMLWRHSSVNHCTTTNSSHSNEQQENSYYAFPSEQKRDNQRDRPQENAGFIQRWNYLLRRKGTEHQIQKVSRQSAEDAAATTIQRYFRGFLGRKEYLQLLYDRIVMEEEEMEQNQSEQVAYGQMLIDSYQLERELQDDDCMARNSHRLINSHAMTIQRAWRRRKGDTECADEKRTSWCSAYSDSDDITPHPYGQSMRNEERYRIDDDSSFSNGSDSARHFSMFDDSLEGDRREEGYCYDDDLNNDNLTSRFSDINIEEEISHPEPTMPSTDWSTIDAVLRTESGIDSLNENDDDDDEENYSSRCRPGPPSRALPHMQMVFLDDDESLSSDADSDPDVKVYVVEEGRDEYNQRRPSNPATPLDGHQRPASSTTCDVNTCRHLDSRDSGCVPGDLIDLNIDYVTDVNCRRSTMALEPAVESKNMLDSILMHEQLEQKAIEQKSQRKSKNGLDNVSSWTERELVLFIEDLQRKLREASDVLVEELRSRDLLHAKQDALLIDVEDLKRRDQQMDARNASSNRMQPR